MEKKKHSSLLLRKQTTCDNQTFPSDKATDIFVSLGAPYLRLCAKAKPCLVNWNGYFFTKIKKKEVQPEFSGAAFIMLDFFFKIQHCASRTLFFAVSKHEPGEALQF